MIRVSKLIAAAMWLTLLQGCLTTYVPAPSESMVTVRAVGFGSPQMCKDGKYYWPPAVKDAPGNIRIPAGERITVGAHLTSEGYQVTHYCRPFLSFVPKDGQSYVLNSGMNGDGRCFTELVREEAKNSMALAVEPSVDRANCSGR